MDPASAGLQSSGANDDFSAGDHEEDPPDETNYNAFPVSIVDAPAASSPQSGGAFQNACWRVGDNIQQALHLCSCTIDDFRRRISPHTHIMAVQPRVESLDRSMIQSHSKCEMTATIAGQLRAMLVFSWINSLLVFVLAGIATYLAGMNPLLVFVCNAIAIVPLSALLTDATERIAARVGDAIGALLNITFGNLVELILFTDLRSIALANNHIYIVQASILGSILVNLLLILGSALLASSMTGLDPIYNTVETQLLACLLFVSVFVILMPTAFAYTVDNEKSDNGAALRMSRISAMMVLLIYILYFAHEIRSRKTEDDTTMPHSLDVESGPVMPGEHPSHRASVAGQGLSGSQTLTPRTIRFADEDSPNHMANTRYQSSDVSEMETVESMQGESDDELTVDRGRRRGDHIRPNGHTHPSSYQPLLRSQRHSRSFSLSSVEGITILSDNRANMDHLVHEQSHQLDTADDGVASVAMLIITSILMSMCAEFLVSTIDDVTHEGGLSEPLIGLIILPIVGNIAEYVTVVTVAVRGKLDLAIAVAVGSSIQIALCVTPLTVMAGWALQRKLELTFSVFEMVTLVGTVMLVNLLILNEGSSSLRTSGLKGALMCACYVIFGVGAYLSPS
ncbi:hypothetical protein FALBO_2639 [Fusarium albosuccineum]|uniref:Sodium/calcium exchanger membrane region domain-containing protein n=1 Tax=Fusarium albosuccineum TaxID=1237068 RepID=A0A8H4LLQ5_9HYPO|nr:hypothetical protein FALBO_2639 [Fusarium albosuccineum]